MSVAQVTPFPSQAERPAFPSGPGPALDGIPRLLALLFYGAGLRLLEGARLRVQDVDFAANLIVVRDGKGAKDRVTMLPAAVKVDLTRSATPSGTRSRLTCSKTGTTSARFQNSSGTATSPRR